MPHFKTNPTPKDRKAERGRVAFMHDMLLELGAMAREGRHDFLVYLIGMARLEAERLAGGGK